MRILILGASGLVGWNLYREAQALGHDVTGTSQEQTLPGLRPFKFLDQDGLQRLLEEIRPEVLYYGAGWSWVDGCERDPSRAQRENAELPALAARLAMASDCRFVYFSTSYVFDGVQGPYEESAIPAPLSVYGQSKLAGENDVLDATKGLALIARTMGVYGAEPQQKNFVYQVRRHLAAGQPMRVPADQFGNATYAPDLARMTLELVERGESGIWNLAGPDPHLRRSDFARQIAAAYDLDPDLVKPVKTADLNQLAPRPVQGGLVIDKVTAALSCQPQAWVRID